jgi:hypothetical protein
VKTALNLATQPVKNNRLPILLFVVASVLLVGGSLYHALLLRRLLPSRSADLVGEVVNLQTEAVNLERQAGRVQHKPVTAVQKAEWLVIKELIDRRTFWWSELFVSLEAALPRGARIVSVTPRVGRDEYQVDLVAWVDNVASGLDFVHVLEERPEFEGVFPRSQSVSQDGYEFTYGMRYLSEAAPGPGGGKAAPLPSGDLVPAAVGGKR